MKEPNTSIEQLKTEPFAAMRIAEFRNLILGRFIFIMGLRMLSTLLGWWIYNLTNAPLAIGIVGLSEFVPAVSFALYAGHVIDLSEKRKLLLRGIVLYNAAVLVLLLLSTPLTSTYLHNSAVAICIFAVVFCTGIIRSFTGPVFTVILAQTVPKNKLQNATTWNQGAWLSASVIGHAIGGFLIAWAGNTGTLTVIASLFFIAFITMLQLKPKPPLNERGEKKTWDSVKEGINFVLKTKELVGAISLDLFAV